MWGYTNHTVLHLLGVIKCLQNDIKNNYYPINEKPYFNKILNQFLDFAFRLQKKNLSHAAAIIAGSTLVCYLQQLCTDNNIETNHTPDIKSYHDDIVQLNNNLMEAGIHSTDDHEIVSEWLELFNKAIEGVNAESDKHQVMLLIDRLRVLISQHFL